MTTSRPALPTSKHAKIVHLLDHWDDIYAPALTTNGGTGNGGMALLPLMSRHASVVELARCLDVLRTVAPVQHAHLKAFHCAEWRTHRWTEQKKHKRSGKWERVERSERQQLVPGWVRREKVRRAEERLVAMFRGPVFIPDELWDALTLSSEEIDVKRRRARARKVAA